MMQYQRGTQKRQNKKRISILKDMASEASHSKGFGAFFMVRRAGRTHCLSSRVRTAAGRESSVDSRPLSAAYCLSNTRTVLCGFPSAPVTFVDSVMIFP
jgi:hypothetical protein